MVSVTGPCTCFPQRRLEISYRGAPVGSRGGYRIRAESRRQPISNRISFLTKVFSEYYVYCQKRDTSNIFPAKITVFQFLPNGRFYLAFAAICGTRNGFLLRLSVGIRGPSNVRKGVGNRRRQPDPLSGVRQTIFARKWISRPEAPSAGLSVCAAARNRFESEIFRDQ